MARDIKSEATDRRQPIFPDIPWDQARTVYPPHSRRARKGNMAAAMNLPPAYHNQALATTKIAHPNWMAFPELTIKLYDLRTDVTIEHIFNCFQKHGNLSFIEIYDSRGSRTTGAKICFCPPPGSNFWSNGKYVFTTVDGSHRYLIRVDMRREDQKEDKIQSPTRPRVRFDRMMTLKPTKLHFGLMEGPDTMMQIQTVLEPSFVVDMLRKRVTVKFAVEHRDPRWENPTEYVSKNKIGKYDRKNGYMFQVSFERLKVIHKLDSSGGIFQLLLRLDSPPQFFRKREGFGHSDELVWSEFSNSWYRQTDIVYDPHLNATHVIALHRMKPVIDIGRWTTYLFEFPAETKTGETFKNIQDAFRDFNIEIEPIGKLNVTPARTPDFWNMIESSKAPHAKGLSTLADNVDIYHLPFEVRYQLEVCISRETINEYNISKAFVEKLAEVAAKDASKARNMLEKVAEMEKRIYDPISIFKNDEILSFSAKTEVPHYCAYARKATITPSTVHYSSPTVETTNRVLRNYAQENKEGRFLRVQFTDELSEGKIFLCKNERNDELFGRVYRTLFNGIQIGDRKFKFLAFGNSQFRENGAYFFCETQDLTCDHIRDWMGSFSHINIAAKYAARLGQCFSTTRAINGLSAPKIVTIPDITRNGFTFTDGVGKISPFLAQMIAHELNIRTPTTPSAFQFRLGGCKGILVTSPDAIDREVHIRRSQQKFTAVYNGLEIIRCSHYSCATLNRQTINILSNLGVPDDVFLKLMSEQLANYQSAMSSDELAKELLLRYIDENQMTINIAQMILNGFMEAQDPFVMSLLHLWRSWSIKLLKEKAKIIVEDGAFVLGCVDETSTLKGYEKPTVPQGVQLPVDELPEIFIQVPQKGSDPKNPIYTVIEGICLVGRNPSLHPGDLRVVRAVNSSIPQNSPLRRLRDVVVFPSTGEMDIPSMCSGGDLDGDDYFVIWDKNLRPQEWNATPMNYSPSAPRTQDHPVQVEDLMKFFVRFMKNDSLPSIALAHQAQSDQLPNGVKNPKCIELAELHSKAVDYVKTGHPAEMPKRLRPKQWPHFMESRHRPKDQIYTSYKILGQLYDKVESVDFKPKYEMPFDRRVLSAFKFEDSLLAAARRLKIKYDTAMRRIMAQHEIKTEFEIWTTFILSKPRVGTDYKQQEEVGRVSDTLKDQFRALCIEAAGGSEYAVLGPFVAGMYKVTKEELDIALEECRHTKNFSGRIVPARKTEPKYMPLITFPWLFEKVLGRIATGVDLEEDLADLGFKPLEFNHQRKRGNKPVTEDYIRREDGVVVHRGEKLDLFQEDGYENEEGALGAYGGLADYDRSGGGRNSPSSDGLRDMEELSNSLTSQSLGGEHDSTPISSSIDSPSGSLPDRNGGESHELKESTLDQEMSIAERELLTEKPIEESDEENEDEEVQLIIEESSLDKLARMVGS